MVNATPRQLYPRERNPAPIVQEAGWTPGPVWSGAEKSRHTGIRSSERPARSGSLYRLSYRGPQYVTYKHYLNNALKYTCQVHKRLINHTRLVSSMVMIRASFSGALGVSSVPGFRQSQPALSWCSYIFESPQSVPGRDLPN